MSECAPAWFAIPLKELTTDARQDVLADILGMRRAELATLLDHDVETLTPMAFDDHIDETCLAAVDGTPCLTWTQAWASNGGEWDAQQLQDHGIPYLRWWGYCSAFEAGAAAFGGRGEPISIRCDSQLEPVVAVRIQQRVHLNHDELRDIRQYRRRRSALLHPRRSAG